MFLPKRKNFSSNEVDLPRLILELVDLFDKHNYKVHRKEGAAGGIVLDANKSASLLNWLGLSRALTIRVTYDPGVTNVWIGNQKVIDKLLIGLVGLVLSPFGFGLFLVLPAAVGAYLQYKIAQDAWSVVEDHVALRSQASPSF